MKVFKNMLTLNHPAAGWDKGMPIGNGRLGAMVMGQIDNEMLLINEESMFYGGPKNRRNHDTSDYIGKIRKLLWEKKAEDAEFLAMAAMTAVPCNLSPFQPAGQLKIIYDKHRGTPSSYLRTLDLDEALAGVSYELDGAAYKREYFASFSGNVIAYSVSGSSPITLMANLNRRPFEEYNEKIDNNTIAFWGRCGPDGVEYFGCARMRITGGECSVIGSSLVANNAQKAEIFLSFATSYCGNSKFKDEALDAVNEAGKKGFDVLKAEHTKAYKSLFDRVSFSINDAETPKENTDTLLEKLASGGDSGYLTVLAFNMGRYLLLSSSYNCRLPANLQGLWNGSFTPPWESAYTVNINLQMNYWPAEVCNLPECHMPLFDLLDKVLERGKDAAKNIYGCRGFMACHNIDMWGDADPVHMACSSTFWVMGGAWLSLHLWEHYLFTQDIDFLKTRAFHVMEQALLFINDYLAEGGDGLLHTGPAVSPENIYITDDGQQTALCMSPAMDFQIIKELYKAYSAASQILNQGGELREETELKIKRLPPIKLTKDGRIMEWFEDYEEKDPGHRHISHLFALHPGTQISEETPDLQAAAEKTLVKKIDNGSGHTGWSGAWFANQWARLKKGNRANEHILGLLNGKTLENMLSLHPPFQIDGNFGFTAAVAEMLIQSHAGYIELLPALPDAWKKGRVTGLRARGGITADITWDNGKLTNAALTADQEANIKVKYRDKTENLHIKNGSLVIFQ